LYDLQHKLRLIHFIHLPLVDASVALSFGSSLLR
jgi:hypothetical protein